ncbi:MAG: methyltransferase [Betaproteobacteria bacterium]
MTASDSTPVTQVFPRHDPATPAFWDVRFDASYTPWDQGGVPQSLANYVAQNPAPKRMLIPGCGSAHEVRFLAERGWDVTAIDFSPAAVAHAKQLLGALAERVHEMDFFGEPLRLQRYEVIYERAFLCALPRQLWTAWAARVAEIIPAAGLLIGFFFFDSNQKGPPFGISPDALSELLSPAFELVEANTPADSISVFAGKEKWQVWRRRA